MSWMRLKLHTSASSMKMSCKGSTVYLMLWRTQPWFLWINVWKTCLVKLLPWIRHPSFGYSISSPSHWFEISSGRSEQVTGPCIWTPSERCCHISMHRATFIMHNQHICTTRRCAACMMSWTKMNPRLIQSVVGAGSDSVCLAAGVLLWHAGLCAGRLTQAIPETWVRIPAMAPATFGVRSPCVNCELIVLHYSPFFISEWTAIAGQGGPKSWAKVDHDRESRWTTIEGQGGPSTRGVRVKAGQDRGSRQATIGGQGGQRWRAKADRDHSEIKKGE